MPDVEVPVLPAVVIHYRAPEWCRSAVAALAASSDVAVDVVVVDNSGELAGDASLPATVLPSGRNTGYAGGANHGLRHVLAERPAAPFVAVCSHDFHPEPSCLRRLLDAAAGDPTLGVVAPRLTAPRPDLGSFFDGRRSRRVEPWPSCPPLFEPDWVSGTCMVIRTEALRAVGGFDEGFGSYMEDVDMCLRIREAGWRVASVAGAEGRGLGSVSDARFRMTAVNVALLAAKREGGGPARRLAVRYALRALRSMLLALLPFGRGLQRRRESMRYAAAQGGAAWDLLTDGRIRRYARDPRAYEPSLDIGAAR